MFQLKSEDHAQFDKIKKALGVAQYIHSPASIIMATTREHYDAYGIADKYLLSKGESLDLEKDEHQQILCFSYLLVKGPVLWGSYSREVRFLLACLRQTLKYKRNSDQEIRALNNKVLSIQLSFMSFIPGVSFIGSIFLSAASGIFGLNTNVDGYKGMPIVDIQQCFTEEDLSDPRFLILVNKHLHLSFEGQRYIADRLDRLYPGFNLVKSLDDEHAEYQAKKEDFLSRLSPLGVPMSGNVNRHNVAAGGELGAKMDRAIRDAKHFLREVGADKDGKFMQGVDQAFKHPIKGAEALNAFKEGIDAVRASQLLQKAKKIAPKEIRIRASAFLSSVRDMIAKTESVIGKPIDQLSYLFREFSKVITVLKDFKKIIKTLPDIVSLFSTALRGLDFGSSITGPLLPMMGPFSIVFTLLNAFSFMRGQGDAKFQRMVLEYLKRISEQLQELKALNKELAGGIHEHIDIVSQRLIEQIDYDCDRIIGMTAPALDQIKMDIFSLFTLLNSSTSFIGLEAFRESLEYSSNVLRNVEYYSPDHLNRPLTTLQRYMREAYSSQYTGVTFIQNALISYRQRSQALSVTDDPSMMINFLMMKMRNAATINLAPNANLWLGFLSAYLSIRLLHKLRAPEYDPSLRILQTQRSRAIEAVNQVRSLVGPGSSVIKQKTEDVIESFSAVLKEIQTQMKTYQEEMLKPFILDAKTSEQLDVISTASLAEDPLQFLAPYANCEVTMHNPADEAAHDEYLAKWKEKAKGNTALIISKKPQVGALKQWFVFWRNPDRDFISGELEEVCMKYNPATLFLGNLEIFTREFNSNANGFQDFEECMKCYYYDLIGHVVMHKLSRQSFNYTYHPGQPTSNTGDRMIRIPTYRSLELIQQTYPDLFSPLLMYAIKNNLCDVQCRMYQSLQGSHESWVTHGEILYGLEVICTIDGRRYELTSPTHGHATWYTTNSPHWWPNTLKSHCEAVSKKTILNVTTLREMEYKLKEKIRDIINKVKRNCLLQLYRRLSDDNGVLYHYLFNALCVHRCAQLLGVGESVLGDLKEQYDSVKSFYDNLGGVLEQSSRIDQVPQLTLKATVKSVMDEILAIVTSPDFNPSSGYLQQLETGIRWLERAIEFEITPVQVSDRTASSVRDYFSSMFGSRDAATTLLTAAQYPRTEPNRRLCEFIHSIFNTTHSNYDVQLQDVATAVTRPPVQSKL